MKTQALALLLLSVLDKALPSAAQTTAKRLSRRVMQDIYIYIHIYIMLGLDVTFWLLCVERSDVKFRMKCLDCFFLLFHLRRCNPELEFKILQSLSFMQVVEIKLYYFLFNIHKSLSLNPRVSCVWDVRSSKLYNY